MDGVGRNRVRRILPIVLGVAALAILFTAPTGGAIPEGSIVGKVTYTDISGTTDLTTNIRSFALKTELVTTGPGGGGGGGGAGKATFGLPRVVQDVVSGSPLILSALASGRHLPTVVVTLYRPRSDTRFQQWTFEDALITLDDQSQKGPASASPWETVSWIYQQVTQTTYRSDGTTVSRSICFDVAANVAC
jgi:type VI protein secretion system component Hcp